LRQEKLERQPFPLDQRQRAQQRRQEVGNAGRVVGHREELVQAVHQDDQRPQAAVGEQSDEVAQVFDGVEASGRSGRQSHAGGQQLGRIASLKRRQRKGPIGPLQGGSERRIAAHSFLEGRQPQAQDRRRVVIGLQARQVIAGELQSAAEAIVAVVHRQTSRIRLLGPALGGQHPALGRLAAAAGREDDARLRGGQQFVEPLDVHEIIGEVGFPLGAPVRERVVAQASGGQPVAQSSVY